MKLLLVFLLFPQLSLAMSMAVTQVVASRQPLYQELVRSLGPVAYWRLGEQSGTNANDDTAGLHDGTYTNTPTLGVTGLLVENGDTAIDFNSAQTEYVTIPDADELDVVAPFTCVVWVDPEDTSGNDMIFTKYEGTNRTPFFFHVLATSGVLRFGFGPTGPNVLCDGTSDLSVGGARMCVGRVIGSSTRVFIDGVQENSCTGSGGSSNGAAVQLGAWNGTGLPYDGIIDEAAIFNYGLSAGQIQMLYYSGTGRQVSPGDSW